MRNQPTTADRRGRRRGCRGRGDRRRARRAARAVGGCARSRSTSADGALRGRGQQRGHGPRIMSRARASGGPTPNRHPEAPTPVPWRGHEGSRRVRRVLQGDPRTACCCRRTRSPATSPSSRAAVRDAFVARLAPLAQGRRGSRTPRLRSARHAWRHAQRRHTARLWHREKGLDPEVKATLDALGQLTMRAAQGAAAHPGRHASRSPQMAREIGLPLERGGARAAGRRGASSPGSARCPPSASAPRSSRSSAPPPTAASRGPRSSAGPAPPGGVRTPPWARSRRWPCSWSAAPW